MDSLALSVWCCSKWLTWPGVPCFFVRQKHGRFLPVCGDPKTWDEWNVGTLLTSNSKQVAGKIMQHRWCMIAMQQRKHIFHWLHGVYIDATSTCPSSFRQTSGRVAYAKWCKWNGRTARWDVVGQLGCFNRWALFHCRDSKWLIWCNGGRKSPCCRFFA